MENIRTKTRNPSRDDATGQAGWMYTDLLLGLVVVFMATISFLPSSLPGLAAEAYVYTEHFDQVFQKAYSTKDVNSDLLTADIKQFLVAYGLPASSIVETVQVIGGFDPTTEVPADGINRAVDFTAALDEENASLLGKASTSVDANSFLDPGAVIVRLKFGAKVR